MSLCSEPAGLSERRISVSTHCSAVANQRRQCLASLPHPQHQLRCLLSASLTRPLGLSRSSGRCLLAHHAHTFHLLHPVCPPRFSFPSSPPHFFLSHSLVALPSSRRQRLHPAHPQRLDPDASYAFDPPARRRFCAWESRARRRRPTTNRPPPDPLPSPSSLPIQLFPHL